VRIPLAGKVAVLAEPDVDTRDLAQIILEGLDLTVHAVADGRTALHACRAIEPQLLVLDAGIGGMSAVQVCRAVRADPDLRTTYVLALVRAEAQVLELRSAGADECLLKPFGPIELRGFFERDPEGP
jgi:DNA-binding response OmpR family regulator